MFFLQSNSRRNGCQVRLCGQAKKKVRGGFNLQELAGKAPETTVYQLGKRKQADPVRKETLLPVFAVAGQDGLDVVLINGKMPIQESRMAWVEPQWEHLTLHTRSRSWVLPTLTVRK